MLFLVLTAVVAVEMRALLLRGAVFWLAGENEDEEGVSLWKDQVARRRKRLPEAFEPEDELVEVVDGQASVTVAPPPTGGSRKRTECLLETDECCGSPDFFMDRLGMVSAGKTPWNVKQLSFSRGCSATTVFD